MTPEVSFTAAPPRPLLPPCLPTFLLPSTPPSFPALHPSSSALSSLHEVMDLLHMAPLVEALHQVQHPLARCLACDGVQWGQMGGN